MKNILFILIALSTLGSFAQRKNREVKTDRKALTAEQVATLQTKKMTLHLNLSDAQQKQIYKLNLENAQVRKEQFRRRKQKADSDRSKRISKEKRYERANKRLDSQIGHKKNIQSILNKEQFEKWEKGQKISMRKKLKGKKRVQSKRASMRKFSDRKDGPKRNRK